MSESGPYGHLSFNAPLSDGRCDAIVARLAAARPASVLDLGCGWGELLLRLAAALPEARCRGVDTDDTLLARARDQMARRGLEAAFENLAAGEVTEPADLVVCVGSSHALGTSPAEALPRLRELVRPGGRLLYGDGTWEENGPVRPELVWADLRALPSVAGLVDLAVDAGFRPVWTEVANQDELFAFESGFLAASEERLLQAEDEELRTRTDEHRNRWLHGYRNGFGFAYLTLARSSE